MISTVEKISYEEAGLQGVIDPGLQAILDRRLVDGQAKYGNSWCEVDLKTDLLEELYDSCNYVLLADARERQLGNINMIYAEMLGYLQGFIAQVERHMPNFAGPTSNEWVKRLVLDDGTV